jgi:hypothetical protein
MRVKFRYAVWLIILLLIIGFFDSPAVVSSNIRVEVPCSVVSNTVVMTVTSDGTVSYGTVAIGTTKNTTSSGDTQTVKNESTASETVTFSIKSSDAIGGTAWTLGAAQGPNTFTHKASVDGGSHWDVQMTTANSYVTLITGVLAGSSQSFDLQIGMPTSVTDYGEHTITVTVLAAQ